MFPRMSRWVTCPRGASTRLLRRSRNTVDLTVARVARVSAARLGFDDDWLPVPDWVGMRLVAPFDLAAIASRSGSAADDLRRTRRGGWSHDVSHRADDLAGFYRDFYLPFVRNRHREEAFVRSLRYLRRRFRRGGVLWVVRGGERLAGVLFELRHDVLDMVAVGVAGGDLRLVKEGALAAAYTLFIEHARATGCVAIDLRGSRPSPADGLTRYKRKWGASIYDRADVLSTTFVHWNRPTPAVVAFLRRTPLVFRDEGGLSVLGVAQEGADAAASAEDGGELRISGLRRVIVLAPGAAALDGVVADDGCVRVPLASVDAGPRAVLAAARRPSG